MIEQQKFGRTRKKLVELLQKEFPTLWGRPVTWKVENIICATGWYRSSRHYSNESYRWSATSVFSDTGKKAHFVNSFYTMTECVKAGRLEVDDEGEIFAVEAALAKHGETK